MLNIMVQPDSRDWSSLPYDPWDFRTGFDLNLSNWRVAYSADLGYATVDPEVAAIVADGLKILESQGAMIDEVDPGFDDPKRIFNAHWDLGAARLVDRVPRDRRTEMDPGLLRIAERGRQMTLNQHADAVDARVELGRKMNLFHDTYDLLVTPAMPIPAFMAGQDLADPNTQEDWTDWSPFTYPFNLTGQPACAVPCGFNAACLPVGLQIVGPRYADASVLQAARAFEQVRPFKMPNAVNVSHLAHGN